MYTDQLISESHDIPDWKILKNSLITSYFENASLYKKELSSYSLVSVFVDDSGAPIEVVEKWNGKEVNSYYIFTDPELSRRMNSTYLVKDLEGMAVIESDQPKLNAKTMMLGNLCSSLSLLKKPAAIRVNPLKVNLNNTVVTISEEVLFSPIFDSFTQKLLLTKPEEAKALLSISPDEQKRFGIEFIFYLLNDRFLPEDEEYREKILKEKLEELAFVIPRVPIKKGSGSFIAILLDLKTELEEMAFIREYKVFDDYSDPIFVTSSLKLLNGKLDEIFYNGDSVDTIFGPLINWQKSKRFLSKNYQ